MINSNNPQQPINSPQQPGAGSVNTIPSKIPNGNKKNLITIVAFSLAGLLLVIVVVLAAVMSSNSSAANKTISKKNDEIKSLNEKISKLESGIEDGYSIISALDLEYPINDNNNEIVYIIDKSDPNKPVVYLSTKSLMLAQLEASRLVPPPSKNACSPADTAAGKISRYSVGDKINGKPVTELTDKGVVKLGNYYYAYTKSTSVCSLNENVQKVQQQANQQAENFFKSLKAREQTK